MDEKVDVERGPVSCFPERVGAAIATPRHALARAARRNNAGLAGQDLFILVALSLVALEMSELVRLVWIGVVDGPWVAINLIAQLIARSVMSALIFVLCASVVITIAAGVARSWSRDFDLACVAVIPIVAIELVKGATSRLADVSVTPTLQWISNAGAYAWAVAIAIVAIYQVRRGPVESRPFALRAKWVGRGTVALIAVIAIANAVWIARNYRQLRPVGSGDQAPAFALSTIEDTGRLGTERVTLRSLRGTIVVLDFWAQWCGPCKRAMPALAAIQRHYDRDVRIVSINIDAASGRLRALDVVSGLGFLLVADDGRTSRQYGVRTIPHIVVIDRLGVVRRVHRGYRSSARLERELRSVIDELM